MSMSSNTSYAEEITSDDDFFTRWLKRLYYSVQVSIYTVYSMCYIVMI